MCDQLLPISAVAQYAYCPRRAALIILERTWVENRYTAEGRRLHQRVADPHRGENRPGVQIVTALYLRSERLKLFGQADLVEFYHNPGGRPYAVIVEYKRGRPKPSRDEEYRMQLCAQALCLEEMMQLETIRGYIYFAKTRHRYEIEFDHQLRQKTVYTVERLHELVQSGQTPPPQYSGKCRGCSLAPVCLPKATAKASKATRYLKRLIELDQPG